MWLVVSPIAFLLPKGLFEEISGEYYLGYLFVEMVGGSDRLIKTYSWAIALLSYIEILLDAYFDNCPAYFFGFRRESSLLHNSHCDEK
jgi:hypothetical protein